MPKIDIIIKSEIINEVFKLHIIYMQIADVFDFSRIIWFVNLKFEPICFENAVDRTTCRFLEFHEICQGMATGEVLVLEFGYGAVGEVFG